MIIVNSQNYQFPFSDPIDTDLWLLDSPGVYLVLRFDGYNYFPIDVGQSDSIRSRIVNHDRKNCWFSHLNGSKPYYSVYYTFYMSEQYRLALEHEIRVQYQFKCGVR